MRQQMNSTLFFNVLVALISLLGVASFSKETSTSSAQIQVALDDAPTNDQQVIITMEEKVQIKTEVFLDELTAI